MKFCQKCHLEYDNKYSFCQKCGNKLIDDSHCPQCNELLEMEYLFCPYCGYKLGKSVSEENLSEVHTKSNHLDLNLGNDVDAGKDRNLLDLSISNINHSASASKKQTKSKKSPDTKNKYNNGFFGFSGRMEKNEFAIKMFFAELLLLGVCYFALLKYWRFLIIGSIILMMTSFLLVGIFIYGLVKRRLKDTDIPNGFMINSVFFLLIISVLAKWLDFAINDTACYVFMAISVLFTLSRLWTLFTIESREVVSSGKEYELHPIVFIDLFMIIPIFYFLYKNVLTIAYVIP